MSSPSPNTWKPASCHDEDEDDFSGTESGALTPTSTIGRSFAPFSINDLSADVDDEGVLKELSNLKSTCTAVFLGCQVLEERTKHLTVSSPAGTVDTLATLGYLLPQISTAVLTLRASPDWVQYGLPRKGLRSDLGVPIVPQSVWDALGRGARGQYEALVQDFVTEVLSDSEFDPMNLGEKASELLMTISLQSALMGALMELHPVRASTSGQQAGWYWPLSGAQEMLQKTYSAWQELSQQLFKLRSRNIDASALYVTQLQSIKGFPRISLSSKKWEDGAKAVRDGLTAAEDLKNSIIKLSKVLNDEEGQFAKPSGGRVS